jgi:hypothetical protein
MCNIMDFLNLRPYKILFDKVIAQANLKARTIEVRTRPKYVPTVPPPLQLSPEQVQVLMVTRGQCYKTFTVVIYEYS